MNYYKKKCRFHDFHFSNSLSVQECQQFPRSWNMQTSSCAEAGAHPSSRQNLEDKPGRFVSELQDTPKLPCLGWKWWTWDFGAPPQWTTDNHWSVRLAQEPVRICVLSTTNGDGSHFSMVKTTHGDGQPTMTVPNRYMAVHENGVCPDLVAIWWGKAFFTTGF